MIETERLLLRPWREEDVQLHNAMCNDAAFMRHLGPPLPMAESAAAAARQAANLAKYGSCFWAVEHRESGRFIGYCGIKPGPDGTPIAGLPEIGWASRPITGGRALRGKGHRLVSIGLGRIGTGRRSMPSQSRPIRPVGA